MNTQEMKMHPDDVIDTIDKAQLLKDYAELANKLHSCERERVHLEHENKMLKVLIDELKAGLDTAHEGWKRVLDDTGKMARFLCFLSGFTIFCGIMILWLK